VCWWPRDCCLLRLLSTGGCKVFRLMAAAALRASASADEAVLSGCSKMIVEASEADTCSHTDPLCKRCRDLQEQASGCFS